MAAPAARPKDDVGGKYRLLGARQDLEAAAPVKYRTETMFESPLPGNLPRASPPSPAQASAAIRKATQALGRPA